MKFGPSAPKVRKIVVFRKKVRPYFLAVRSKLYNLVQVNLTEKKYRSSTGCQGAQAGQIHHTDLLPNILKVYIMQHVLIVFYSF